MNKIFEKANEDGSKTISYTDRIEMYDTNNKLCGILGNLDSYEELQKKAELGEHYKHLYSEVKKQKDDVVELCNKSIKSVNDRLAWVDTKKSYPNEYQRVRLKAFRTKCKEILRLLGEIDVED